MKDRVSWTPLAATMLLQPLRLLEALDVKSSHAEKVHCSLHPQKTSAARG